MKSRREQLTDEVTERLSRVCAHLPEAALADLVRRVVDVTMKYEGRATPAASERERPFRPMRDDDGRGRPEP